MRRRAVGGSPGRLGLAVDDTGGAGVRAGSGTGGSSRAWRGATGGRPAGRARAARRGLPGRRLRRGGLGGSWLGGGWLGGGRATWWRRRLGGCRLPRRRLRCAGPGCRLRRGRRRRRGIGPGGRGAVVDVARFVVVRLVVDRLVVDRFVVARFARAAGRAAAALVAAGLAVAGVDAVDFAGVRFVAVFRVAVFRVVAGLRVTRRLAAAATPAVRRASARGAALTGVTAFAALDAAVPAPAAAAPNAPAALPAAVPAALSAAARARPAICTTRPATSADASAACRRRFSTCLRPFVPSALASWASRLVSSARALSNCLPSFFSSRAALPVTGADACWAAETTFRRRRRRPRAGWSVSPLMRRSSTSPSAFLPLHVSRPMQGRPERYHSEINAERSSGPNANILLTACRQPVSGTAHPRQHVDRSAPDLDRPGRRWAGRPDGRAERDAEAADDPRSRHLRRSGGRCASADRDPGPASSLHRRHRWNAA